jgi:hypothetical protein
MVGLTLCEFCLLYGPLIIQELEKFWRWKGTQHNGVVIDASCKVSRCTVARVGMEMLPFFPLMIPCIVGLTLAKDLGQCR